MRAPVGIRIRRQRLNRGLSQAALARLVGISPSYLNRIENNNREVSGGLLMRIAEHLQLDIDALSGAREQKALQRVQEMLGDPLFQGLDFSHTDTRELVAHFPEIAQALGRLYRGYADAGAEIDAYANRFNSDPLLAQMLHEVLNRITGMRSGAEIISNVEDLSDTDRRRFTDAIAREAQGLTGTMNGLVQYFDRAAVSRRATSPLREVEDAIIHASNHFPELEETAQALCASIHGPFGEDALIRHLQDEYGIACRKWPEDTADESFPLADHTRLDMAQRVLWLRGSAPYATRQFRICRQIAQLAAAPVLQSVCDGLDLTSPEARKLAMTALASYVAGAMIMPHNDFRQQAETHHYDIDLLSHRFMASFEQVAHRLVTLRHKGAEAVPFGFLRADAAGRLTKRFPLPGLTLPGAGHGCLLWPIYSAAGSQRVIRQVAEFPNGARFLLIAKSVTKRISAWQEQPLVFSIMLACDIHHADRTVYARGLDLGDSRISVPVGPSCLLCTRENCSHRQEIAPLATS